VCDSGGRDSTVLRHITRGIYPDTPSVFCDTGLEFPEIKKYIRGIPNVVVLRPELSFRQVIEKYGWPVVSKENAQKIREARTTKSCKLLRKRLFGADNKYKSGKIPECWKFLIHAPFKISEQCCGIMKKKPFHKFERETGLFPLDGTMAADSHSRSQQYMRHGCIRLKRATPIAFWTKKDILGYIDKYKVSYCSIYDKGYSRTGCIWCAFGVRMEQKETGTNRFKLLQATHPPLYDYCMDILGMKDILNYVDKDILKT
jgi:3'-phosphoadenosine 5'-phosphosulfate sulfotransferase (PAPS reductase)/FAD synthetase